MAEITIREKQYILPEGITIIGRGEEADIQIDSGKLSRLHMRFSVKGDEVAIEDLGSKNGTFVNGEKLTGRKVLDGSESVKIADIECKLWGERKKEAAPVKQEIPKKTPGPSLARKEPLPPEGNKNVTIQIIAGSAVLVFLIILLIGLGTGDGNNTKQGTGTDFTEQIAYAREALNSAKVTDNVRQNDQYVDLLTDYIDKLGQIKPSAGKPYHDAVSLMTDINRKREEISLANDLMKRAEQGEKRFQKVKTDYQAGSLTPPEAISRLEELAETYSTNEAGAKARSLAGEIASETKRGEKLGLASVLQNVAQYSNSREYGKALELLDEAAQKKYYFLEEYDLQQIPAKRREIVDDASKTFKRTADRLVRQAETGDCEKLKQELKSEFDAIGISEIGKLYTEAAGKIDQVRAARLAKAREALKKDLETLEAYEKDRLYGKADEMYTILLKKITDEELRKEISQRQRKNSLFALIKKEIIALAKAKGGMQVEGLGFIRKIDPELLEVISAEGGDISYRWKRIEDHVFWAMVDEVMKVKEQAEFYILLGYHQMGNGEVESARLNFGKARNLSPDIFKKYPDLVAYMRSGVEGESDVKSRIDSTTGIKEDIPEPDLDIEGDLMTGEGDYIIVLRIEKPDGTWEHKLMRVTKSRRPPRLEKLQDQVKEKNKYEERMYNKRKAAFREENGRYKKFPEEKPEPLKVSMVGKAVQTEAETKDIIMADKLEMMAGDNPAKRQRAKLMKEYLLDHFTVGTNAPIEWFNESRKTNGCNWDFRAAYFPGGGQHGWDKVFLDPWNKWVNPDKKRGMQQRIWIEATVKNGYIPWITMYNLAQSEPANYKPGPAQATPRNMKIVSTMKDYWDQVRLVMQICNEYAPHPFVIQIEPDEWGHMLLTTNKNKTLYPLEVDVKVGSTGMEEIKDLEDNLRGYTRAWLRLRDMYAPTNVLLAANPSAWDEKGSMTPDKWNSYFTECEAVKMDLAVFETGDRDRGCPSSQGGTPRENPPFGEDVVGHFGTYEAQLKYIKRFHELTGLYVVFWQVAVGNTYFKSCNQTNLHYCDNIVQKVLGDYPRNNMISRYVDAGCIGFVFSSGQGFQTHVYDAAKDGITNPSPIKGNLGNTSEYADDDGGYFRLMGSAYYKQPYGILNNRPKSGPQLPIQACRPLRSDPYEELLYHRYAGDSELAWEAFRIWRYQAYASIRDYSLDLIDPNGIFFGE